MSIIHNIIKSETGQDSFELMKKLFESDTSGTDNETQLACVSLPEPNIIDELKPCEEKLSEAMNNIVTPLCLIILQCGITRVHFAGAITSCPYFEALLGKLISEKGINATIDKIRPYLKDQYKGIRIMKVKTTFEKSGNSALLDGVEQLINRSLATSDSGGISFHFSVSIPARYKSQYYVGFLGLQIFFLIGLSTSQKERFCVSIRTDVNTLYALQDFETFIIKFSPVVDVTKIETITTDNYYDLGISEFERFSMITLYVDYNNIITTNPKYLVRGDVDEKYVTLEFFYTLVTRYMKSVVKIEREGRMERVPVNDVVRSVLDHSESDETTWYGLNYETKFVLQPCSSNRLSKQEKEDESKGFEKFFKAIAPTQTRHRYQKTQILCINVEDDLKVQQEIKKACVSCGAYCDEIPQLFVTSETLASYKENLNKPDLICGPICKSCRNQYRRNIYYHHK
ncbi:hypothetical protein FDP41_000521 [Naegleria fowleri]|uniref:Uncharacterized protein n=1 Tax=Naegleria fowleri TaxID=5763 RepID=A0A6A5CC29_NAEFO|nr:uncharacterized protein FDP41_000521 [Naegleria fowleri]KAF0984622.1 hypothetical protein FDP41_000521 [Naegleria fowleri]